ncbi:FAD-linked oxidoreductase-like protein, partial [Trichophaea hybrida]
LSRLPTSSLFRALFLHTVTSSPALLGMGTKLMLKTADNIDHIPPLKWAVDKTFYAHFCAGSTPEQIQSTITTLRTLGYLGIILAYAREVSPSSSSSTSSNTAEISQWLTGTLQTISLTSPGDFVAIKLTGAGSSCIPLLASQRPCTDVPQLANALDTICAAAQTRGIGLLVDAEQAALQTGVDNWTLHYMRKFNRGIKAVVYNTYQMYLKRSRGTLRRHLALAEEQGWRLGVKLVRGAYLHSDPREMIWDTKGETDMAYNDAAEMLISQGVDTVVASHNRESVMKALELKRIQGQKGGELVFAQLMGMADELSLELAQEGGVKVLKYAVWGGTGECVKYLLRRADENKDATARSGENYRAVVEELGRRLGV